MNKLALCLLILLSPLSICSGQNLVLNGDFEEFDSCYILSRKSGSYELVEFPAKYFQIPNNGTTDYYNLEYDFPQDSNYQDLLEAIPILRSTDNCFSGKGWIGLLLLTWPGYIEQITGTLKTPLTEGVNYVIDFHLKCAEDAEYCTDVIGIKFYDDLKETFYHCLPAYWEMYSSADTADVEFDISNSCNTSEWLKYTNNYTARGNEQYFTLGYFYQDNKDYRSIFEEYSGLSNIEQELFKEEYENIGPLIKRNDTANSINIFKYRDRAYYFLDSITIVEECSQAI